jgi:Uri superfamily endonuclease
MPIKQLPREPGTYVLILRSLKAQKCSIGKAGQMDIRPGFYLYTGSALGPGGLRARAGRHLQGSTALRWHIDHLRRAADAWAAWLRVGPEQAEHDWAATLRHMPELTPGMHKFGATDCACGTHLFYTDAAPCIDRFRHQLQLNGLAANVAEICCQNIQPPG